MKNYLIEGVSCTGKTTICDALAKRGYHTIHGDRELAYQGDPETGKPTEGISHNNHIWNVERLRQIALDHTHPVTFFCGGSRNFPKFIDLFDKVFVLEISLETLNQRLAIRPDDEFGSSARPDEQAMIRQLHASGEDVPKDSIRIDANGPVDQVVVKILTHCK